jgi:hypothetical protein
MRSPRPLARRRAAVLTPGFLAGALLLLGLTAVPAAGRPTTGARPQAIVDTAAAGTSSDPSPAGSPAPTGSSAGAPAPAAGVRVAAADVALGPGYWSGSTGAVLRYRVVNTGDAAERVSVSVAIPHGVKVTTTGGCIRLANGTLSCAHGILAAGASATRPIGLSVDPAAWRDAPLGAVVTAAALVVGWPSVATVRDHDGYSVLFPPGPPARGMSLSVPDVAVDAGGSGTLTVRLANTGAVGAVGGLTVLGPAGSRLTPLDSNCVQPAAATVQCALGTVPAGSQAVATFRLAVGRPAAAGALPPAGSVRARLTPSGQDPQFTQASFRVVTAPPMTSASPSPAAPAGPPWPASTGNRRKPPAVVPTGFGPRTLSAAPIVGALVGLFAVTCVLVVLAVRGRRQAPLPDLAGDPLPLRAAPVRRAIEGPRGDS